MRCSSELLDKLHALKQRGESYEDVVWRMIDAYQSEPAIPEEPPERPFQEKKPEQDDIETAIDAVDIPSGRDRDECAEAVRAARDYLRENDRAGMRDFVRDVMPDHPIGYDVPELEKGDRYRGAWWRRILKPALREMPDVKAPEPHESQFRYER